MTAAPSSRLRLPCPRHRPGPRPAVPAHTGPDQAPPRPWGRRRPPHSPPAGPLPLPSPPAARCGCGRRPLRPEQVPGEEAGQVPAGRTGRCCSPRARRRERAGRGRAPRKRRGGRGRAAAAAPPSPLAAAPWLPAPQERSLPSGLGALGGRHRAAPRRPLVAGGGSAEGTGCPGPWGR